MAPDMIPWRRRNCNSSRCACNTELPGFWSMSWCCRSRQSPSFVDTLNTIYSTLVQFYKLLQLHYYSLSKSIKIEIGVKVGKENWGSYSYAWSCIRARTAGRVLSAGRSCCRSQQRTSDITAQSARAPESSACTSSLCPASESNLSWEGHSYYHWSDWTLVLFWLFINS